MYRLIPLLFLVACGGSSPSAGDNYCETATRKLELCFGQVSDAEFDQIKKECTQVDCGLSDQQFKNAEEAVVAMSCAEFSEVLFSVDFKGCR